MTNLKHKIAPLLCGPAAWALCSALGPQINLAPDAGAGTGNNDGGQNDGGNNGGGDAPYYPEGLGDDLRGATNNETIDKIFKANSDLLAAQENGQNLYKPEGMAEHLLGANNNETIDKILKENSGFRDAMAKSGAVPKTPDEYKFELSDQAKAAFELSDNDAGLKLFKEVLHKEGVTDQAFAAFPKFLDAAIEAGLVPKPVSADEVFGQLAPEGFKGGKLDAVAEGAKRVTTALAHVDTLLGNKKIDEGIAQEMKLLVGSVNGVRALEAMMNTITPGNQPGGDNNNDEVTRESLQARKGDPRNDRNHKDYDPKFAQETDRQYKEFFKDK